MRSIYFLIVKCYIPSMSTLDRAISIAAQAFEGKHDKSGRPYILHCITVMRAIERSDADDEQMIIAILHDIIEDTNWTAERLQEEGFSVRVVTALGCLTHLEGEDYDAYIRRIATNHDARKVKLADLRHNSDIMRLKGLREKDFRRMEKYQRSYEYLRE